MNVYVELTREFNDGALRAILSSGQAVVLHRLAVMSKDGDWILREEREALRHVLGVLAGRGARYRYGAPLDPLWLRGGWSSHFEFREGGLRVRADFVTRPPRIGSDDLAQLWREQEGASLPFVDARRLVELKKTDREKDYAVIGELARLLREPRDRLLHSRSARDLLRLTAGNPGLAAELTPIRPLLAAVAQGREAVEAALDAERRRWMRENEARIDGYLRAAAAWASMWPALSGDLAGLPLPAAHERLVEAASGVLPERPGVS